MIQAPNNWAALEAADGSTMELSLTIDGVEYGNDKLIASDLRLAHELYQSYGVGNANAARLTATILDPTPVSDGVLEVKLRCRYVSEDGGTVTGWVDQGTYYLDTFELDETAGVAKLTCYDALALTDLYLYEGGDGSASTWPKAASSVVTQIESRTGAVFDRSNDSLWKNVVCSDVDFITCRQALQSIAAIAGGNWTARKDGKIAFKPLGDASGRSPVATVTCAQLSRTSGQKQVSGVRLSNDSETFTGGGGAFVLEAECLYASQSAATSAYYATRNKRYVGYDAQGVYMSALVELGDMVEVADTGERVLVDSVSLLYEQGTWGSVKSPMADEVEQRIGKRASSRISRLASSAMASAEQLSYMSTSEYISCLLERVNEQANETGGYTYITEGQGIRTYDTAVTDPLVGAEASSVVEVKGGTIRIANSRYTSGEHAGEWEWLTVFESGHIASQLVTAANIVAGFIGSRSGNYWNLDTGELRMGGMSADAIAGAADKMRNLSVGGTNLLTGTDEFERPKAQAGPAWADGTWALGYTAPEGGEASYDAFIIDVDDSPNNMVSKALWLVSDDGTEVWYHQGGVPVEVDEKYVLSCYARPTGNATVKLIIAVGSGTARKSSSVDIGEGWNRYYIRFSFDDAAAVEGGVDVSFGVSCDSEGAAVLCGLKLERGTVVTDWSPSPFDDDMTALGYAEEALTKAAAHTDKLNELLDDPDEVFDRLTAKGTRKGLYMTRQGADNNLYINADYIKSGRISGDLIEAGTIRSNAKTSGGEYVTRLRLDDGALINMAKDNSEMFKLSDGRLEGFRRNGSSWPRVGYIDASASAHNIRDTSEKYYGLQLQGDGIVRISTPRLSVSDSSNVSVTTTCGYTGKLTLRNVTFGMNSNMTQCKTGDIILSFINGILTGFEWPGSFT